MPMLNVTIDDASPLITYDGAWNQSFSDESYAGGYMSTFTQHATATFEFWGTGVQVNGSKNNNHGNYTVSLNKKPHPQDGYLPYPDEEWNTSLFTVHNLTEGLWTLEISNDGWDTLDIDSITWWCNLGQPNDTNLSLAATTVPGTDDAFTWSGSWAKKSPNDVGPTGAPGQRKRLWYLRSSHHSGEAVAIYGMAGPGYSRYTVQPSDQPEQDFDASRNAFSSQVLLYFGHGFEPGANNTITLINNGPGLFQVDHAVVHNALSSSTTISPIGISPGSVPPTGTPTIPTDTDSARHGLSAGIITAIITTSVVFLMLLAALILLLQRNKTLWYRLQRGYKVQSQFDVGSPPNGFVTPLPYSSPPLMRHHKTPSRPDPDNTLDPESQPLNRAATSLSAASTLVAEVGSRGNRPWSLKSLHLASRWGPNTPTSASTPSMRHSGLKPLSLSLTPSQQLFRSPSTRHLLQEESQYDPDAAAAPENTREQSVEDVLQHPIRRNEPSISMYHWQSRLP
ncbi:hypothetical protein R3P38DRAFT_3187320 [Favolaschia claudopus]|uniref:Uncharacterized protein n=1 Tax=Favolaschia claudopus TaxID=2862362 RepID=A0AAW0BXH9_9AGAR